MSKSVFFYHCLIALLIASSKIIFSQSLTDTLDGKLDFSQMLASQYGFLPVPFLVTEPALGYGGGAALVFIHRTPEEIAAMKRVTPDITGVLGMYTQSNSWVAGGGHLGFWDKGNIKFRGGAAYLSLNLKWYPEFTSENIPDELKFNIQGLVTYVEAVFRLFDSDFYAGGSYAYARTTVKFDAPEKVPEIVPSEFDQNIGGLGGIINYDTRDNIFTPNTGMSLAVQLIYFDKIFGSDDKFQRLFTYWLGFAQITKEFFGGLRLDYQNSFGEMPFYLRPYVALRGIPSLRYQGKSTYLAETELRWDVNFRWSLVGFTGYGEAQPVNKDLMKKLKAYNYGLGFRYLIARSYGVRMGIDIARGPEEWAFYIQFGSSWFSY